MNPFFDSSSHDELLRAAGAWLGTPFAPAGAVPGPRGGANCGQCAVGVLIMTGFPISQSELPAYPLNRATHHPGSIMVDWLRQHPDRFAEVASDQIQPGDILVLKLGVGAHHVALAMPDGQLFQSWQGVGAHFTTYRDPMIAKRIFAVYRPLKALLPHV